MRLGLGLHLGLQLGSSGGSVINPATLSLSGWYKDYGGGNWAGTASAGGSGTLNLEANTCGNSTLNGHGIATFNGAQSKGDSSHGSSTYLAVDNYTVGVVVKPKSPAAPDASVFVDPNPIGDDGAQFGLRWSTSGVAWYHNDTVRKTTPWVACSADSWHKVWIRYNGTTDTLEIRVDGGSWSAYAGTVGSITSLAGVLLYVGRGYTAACVCDVAEVITAQTPLSDATIDQLDAYFAARYAL
jgi:hypothetical protein